MKTGWWKTVLFAGLLVVASVSASLGKEPWEVGSQDGDAVWVGFSMTPQVPRLGEAAEVVAKVVATTYDVPKAEIFFGDGKGNLIGVELVNCKQRFTTSLKRGVPKEFRFKIKFIGSPAGVYVRVNAKHYRLEDGHLETNPYGWAGGAGYGLVMNKKTKEFRMPDLMKDPYSELQEELGLPQGGYWYSVTVSLSFDIKEYAKQRKQSEEEVLKLLKAKAEALAKQRKIKREEAYRVISKERLLWKDAGLPDPFYRSLEQQQKDSRLRPMKDPSPQVATRLSGYWYYDDHKYDLVNGLWGSPGDTSKTIRRCLVEVWDLGNIEFPHDPYLDTVVVTGPTDGYFNANIDLPPSVWAFSIRFRLKAMGPAFGDIRLMVQDSAGKTWEYDTTVTVYAGQTVEYRNLHPWRFAQPDSQPASAAWNIYDAMYRAATTKVGYPPRIVRAIWSPRYRHLTSYRGDTIWVNGNWDGPGVGDEADEWHDDGILHEYGHFVHHYWTDAYLPTSPHWWYGAFPNRPHVAFLEGWAEFFSGAVREGVTNNSWGVNDSLEVMTNGHPGSMELNNTFWSYEEPWHFKIGDVSHPDSFKAGPWCEGAACATLFDILDRYDENPYFPPHPLLPEWPDTGVADTLRVPISPPWLQSPIFNIVKNYRTLTGPVMKIYDFLAGWRYPPDPLRPGEILPSYGHWSAIKSILKHHRIPWIEPSRPLSIVVVAKAHPRRVRATWPSVRLLDQSSIQGYNLYRTVDGPSPKYTRLTPAGIADTVYEDGTVAPNTTYRYFVTAVDTFGMESDSTLSEAVTTEEGIYDPLATAYNNAPKILRDRQRVLHVAYTDSSGCYYVTSSDSGQIWSSPLLLGPGRYPGLALDGRDSLFAVWTKPPGPAPDTEAQILYSRRHGDGTWDVPVPLARYTIPGADIYGLSPAALVVQNDTARVVYECYNGTRIVLGPMYNWFYSIFHGTFSISAPQSVRWQLLDSLHAVVPPHILGITSPSVAADFNHLSHVVWHRLGKVCYREQIGDTLWKPLVDLSQSADWTSWHPSLNLSGNRLGVAWVLESETLLVDVIPPSAICYRSRLLGDTIWSVRETLSVGLQYSTRPVLSEGPSAAFSASPTGGGPSEVYLNNRGTSGWTAPENVSNTPLGSNFPHLFTVQGTSERVMDFLWTEGDAAPYEVVYRELSRPIPPRPWYEADVGQAYPSLFTVQRDGFLVYGPLPYQTIDYDHQKLIYRFPGLDTLADYRLLLVAYFEKQVQRDNDADRIASASPASDLASPVPDGIALESSKPKIEQIVLLNGVEVGRMELVPGVPDTFSFVIPKALYQGGEVQLTLDKKKGRFASLSELYLYRWGAWGKKGAPSQGASQGGEGVTLLPKVYDLSQSYPNPAQEGLRINYALPRESQVSLKVYNVMGQMVRSLREGKEKPGYYAAEWNGKDQQGRRVASGVYLYRMEAGSFAKTRKLVVVR